METIKINKDKPIYSEKKMDIKRMVEHDTTLDIYLYDVKEYTVGDKIHFKRYVLSEQYENLILVKETIVHIIAIFEDRIRTEIPKRDGVRVLSAETLNGETRLVFESPINIFAQDLLDKSSLSITLTDKISGGQLTNIKMSEQYNAYHNVDIGVKAEDFLKKRNYWEVYGCQEPQSGFTEVDEIYYIPNRLRRYEIFGTLNGISIDALPFAFAYVSENEFYYKDGKGNCTFWYDNRGIDKLLNNSVQVTREIGYWQVSIGAIEMVDDVHLDQERLLNEVFTEQVKESIIPPVIDMERVKYKPLSSIGEASGLTFNLHFRTREKQDWSYTSGNTWFSIPTPSDITKDSSAVTHSDLLCDLNFIDTDVEYQKMKIKKSFIRLSFYNSDDPITQSMLYYSTIFLDGGALYGKFMKRRTELMESDPLFIENEEADAYEKNLSYVLESCSGDTKYRMDSQFNVSDEYNVERSSEGFNLYLFKDDAPENGEKTIYMKVEFNHAGYGRTIPMVVWPKDGDLSIDNYTKALYIPVKIQHINDKYYYNFSIDNEACYNESEDGRVITLNLFEPKLTS